MTRKNFAFETQSFKGEWWLPGKEDERIQGVLDFDYEKGARLRLSGSLVSESFKDKATSSVKVSIILGRTDKARIINLYNCFSYTEDLIKSIKSQNFSIEFLFIGDQLTPHLKSCGDYKFQRVDFRFSGNTFWIRDSYVAYHHPSPVEELCFNYKSQSHENIGSINGFNISILDKSTHHILMAMLSLADGKNFVDYEIQEKYLSLSSSEPRIIDDFVEAAILFKSFLMFCMNQKISFSKASTYSVEQVTRYKTPSYSPGDKIPEEQIENKLDLGGLTFTQANTKTEAYQTEEEVRRSLYFSMAGIYEQESEIDRNIFTLSFTQIKNSFSGLIEAWESHMSGDMKIVIQGYFKSMLVDKYNYEDIFLEQVKALEAFHKIEYVKKKMDFRARITDLIEKYKAYFPTSYLSSKQDEDDFAKEVTKQRNAFSHTGGDTLLILNSIDNRKARYMIKSSRLLLLICLLAVFEAPKEVIQSVAESKWLRGF